VSGTVVDASGAPLTVPWIQFTHFWARGSSSRSVTLDADGKFVVAGILPGEYAIEAEVGGPGRPEQRRDLEAAFVPVHITSSDVDDVVVALTKAVLVTGRVVLDDSAASLPTDANLAPLMVWAIPAGDLLPNVGGFRSALVAKDRTFVFDKLIGRRTIDVVNVPPGWFVKSIRYGRRDVTN
jgi:hypothetical protein